MSGDRALAVRSAEGQVRRGFQLGDLRCALGDLRRALCNVVLVAALFVPAAARAQDTHLLVIVGVGGDEAHVKTFGGYGSAIVAAAKKQGMPPANITYLGENPEQSGGTIKARATRETVTKAFTDIAAAAKPNDEIFVVLVGHGNASGSQAAFNLVGPDLSAEDYAALLARFRTQKIVFVNTASSSGAFLAPLAGPARTIVTATKTGGERNETVFPQFFVEALDSEAADRDRNGRVSVQEAFDYAVAKVKGVYEKDGHILTEHATLDDGSEGKLASAQYLAPPRSRTVAAQNADPALRALLEQRDTLERQVSGLRLKKDSMPAEQYDQQLEKLLTDLAVKTRAIREMEAKK